jgi:hypothetical protein
MPGCGQFAVHGATVTRTAELVSPRRPSDPGVAKYVLKSAVAYSRNEDRYVPVGDADGRVTSVVQVVEPIGRR